MKPTTVPSRRLGGSSTPTPVGMEAFKSWVAASEILEDSLPNLPKCRSKIRKLNYFISQADLYLNPNIVVLCPVLSHLMLLSWAVAGM